MLKESFAVIRGEVDNNVFVLDNGANLLKNRRDGHCAGAPIVAFIPVCLRSINRIGHGGTIRSRPASNLIAVLAVDCRNRIRGLVVSGRDGQGGFAVLNKRHIFIEGVKRNINETITRARLVAVCSKRRNRNANAKHQHCYTARQQTTKLFRFLHVITPFFKYLFQPLQPRPHV